MSNDQLALVVSGGSFAIAVLALVWTIAWSIWQHLRTHNPRVHVTANVSFPLLSDRVGPECIGVSIANTGAVPVSIKHLVFRVRSDPKHRSLLPSEWMHVQLPQPLGVGETWSAPLVPIDYLRHSLSTNLPELADWRLVVVATDHAGREHTADIDVTPRA